MSHPSKRKGDNAELEIAGRPESEPSVDITHLRAPTDAGPGTGEPWCHFTNGSLYCTNGEHCLNPNHRTQP